MKIVAFRGATAWEAQIGPVWGRLSFPLYWRFAWPITIGWERD